MATMLGRRCLVLVQPAKAMIVWQKQQFLASAAGVGPSICSLLRIASVRLHTASPTALSWYARGIASASDMAIVKNTAEIVSTLHQRQSHRAQRC
jgi:hypothetical protein